MSKTSKYGLDVAGRLSEPEMAEIRRRHVERYDSRALPMGMCKTDWQFWPCDVAKLLAEVEALRAENERLRAPLTEVSEWIGAFNHGLPLSEVRRIQAYLQSAIALAEPAGEKP